MLRERRTHREEAADRDLEKIIEVGKRHRQLGLYLYLVEYGPAAFTEIYKVYNEFTKHRVEPETVKRQLDLLERKGLVKEDGGTYRAVPVPPEALAGLFDIKRSRAGRWGAQKSLRHYLYSRYRELPAVDGLSPKLRGKLVQVLEVTRSLVERGEREAALGLLAHSLLPVRQTGVLWLWKGDTFLYYERKIMESGTFHSVRFPLLSKLLKDLGYEEGILVYHTLGSSESRQYLRKIFGYDNTYPLSRSLFYSMKRLGLSEEGDQYLVEIQYLNNTIQFILKDIYGNTIQSYTLPWATQPPPLERDGDKKVYLSLGVQHVKKSNEGSYFRF